MAASDVDLNEEDRENTPELLEDDTFEEEIELEKQDDIDISSVDDDTLMKLV